MKILVVIASYGHKNDKYLAQVIAEYRSMGYSVDIVVQSNVPKQLGPDVQVLVGLPTPHPKSLTFGHRKVFAERLRDYDLFIYTEDDILITERNIDAFRQAASVLPDTEVAGFLLFENATDGTRFFPDLFGYFHWDVNSLRIRGKEEFAFFTNEHAACFVLTQPQLRKAIDSGGFLVPPHEGKYNIACSAATDPYTQCGMTKMICVSRLDDFLVHHLPNKYVGKAGVHEEELNRQVCALRDLGTNGHIRRSLFNTETKLPELKWSKSYYEPVSDPRWSRNHFEPCVDDLLALIPSGVSNVLSVGCGWGAAERLLIERGLRVVGLPLDPVIGACAQANGVEIVQGDFATAYDHLKAQQFDCILLSKVLHLLPDPVNTLSELIQLLSPTGFVVASVPNLAQLPVVWKLIRRDSGYRFLGNYRKSGVHLSSPRLLRSWLKRCNLVIQRTVPVIPSHRQRITSLSPGPAKWAFASDVLTTAKKRT